MITGDDPYTGQGSDGVIVYLFSVTGTIFITINFLFFVLCACNPGPTSFFTTSESRSRPSSSVTTISHYWDGRRWVRRRLSDTEKGPLGKRV